MDPLHFSLTTKAHPTLHQHQAKLGPQNSSISITQKLVRNANSQGPPQTYEISISRASAQQSQQALTSFLGDAHGCSSLRTSAVLCSFLMSWAQLSVGQISLLLCVCMCVCKVYAILKKFITLGVTTMHRFGENEQVCILIQITTLLQLSPTCPYITLPQPLLLIFLYTALPIHIHTLTCAVDVPVAPCSESQDLSVFSSSLGLFIFPRIYVFLFLSHIVFSLPHFISTTPHSPKSE